MMRWMLWIFFMSTALMMIVTGWEISDHTFKVGVLVVLSFMIIRWKSGQKEP